MAIASMVCPVGMIKFCILSGIFPEFLYITATQINVHYSIDFRAI